MSGIYIPIDKLENGTNVQVIYDAAENCARVYGWAYDPVKGAYLTRLKDAIIIPDHGRLIDADAILNKLQALYDEREDEARYTGSREIKVCWNDAVYQIKCAPTIIPADKDGGE